MSVCTSPMGRRWDSENPSVGTAPGAIPPDWLAGVSNRRENPVGRRFSAKWQRNLPQSRTLLFPRLLASGSSRASASQGLSPGYWCPLPTSGRRISVMGAARGRKISGLCQPVSEGLKHNVQTIPWRRKLLPSPQSDQVPQAATHLQREDVVAVKSCTWDDCKWHSEPQHPCHSQPLSSQQGQG